MNKYYIPQSVISSVENIKLFKLQNEKIKKTHSHFAITTNGKHSSPIIVNSNNRSTMFGLYKGSRHAEMGSLFSIISSLKIINSIPIILYENQTKGINQIKGM
jgi:hypothetical protein